MGELDAAHVEPLFDAQEPAVDEACERIGRRAGRGERLLHALLGEALAKAGLGEELVLDEMAHAGRLVGERALVELGEDRVVRAGEEIGRDLASPLGDPRVVELAADEREQRRLDLRVAKLRAACDEAHDRLGDFLRDEPAAGLRHGLERLLARHRREPHAVLRDRRHRRPERLEMREIVLAQRDQHPVVGAREVELLGDRVVVVDPRLERLRRPILDEIGQLLDELCRALAPEIVALREREHLLELIEDQKRRQRAAGRVAQHVAAVVQEFPQRFTGDRRADVRPLAGRLARAEDRLLDLLRRRWRVARVIDAHVHRAVAERAQSRHDAGAQDRRLAEARLAEQQRQELALDASSELGDLLLAPEEERARFLGERREAKPRVVGIDGGRLRGGVVERRQRRPNVVRRGSPAGGARTPA